MAKGKIISSTFWILKLIYVPISLSKKKLKLNQFQNPMLALFSKFPSTHLMFHIRYFIKSTFIFKFINVLLRNLVK